MLGIGVKDVRPSPSDKANFTKWRNVSYMRGGKPEQVAVEVPANTNSDASEEAVHFVQTLEDNQQIQHEPGPLKSGKTHQVETDAQGNKLLIRKRFSAI